jgi:hypothetical protein
MGMLHNALLAIELALIRKQPKNRSYELRACKGFHQSVASAKLNPELRLFIEPEKDFINRLRAPN